MKSRQSIHFLFVVLFLFLFFLMGDGAKKASADVPGVDGSSISNSAKGSVPRRSFTLPSYQGTLITYGQVLGEGSGCARDEARGSRGKCGYDAIGYALARYQYIANRFRCSSPAFMQTEYFLDMNDAGDIIGNPYAYIFTSIPVTCAFNPASASGVTKLPPGADDNGLFRECGLINCNFSFETRNSKTGERENYVGRID